MFWEKKSIKSGFYCAWEEIKDVTPYLYIGIGKMKKKREDIDERGKRILVFVVGSIGDGVWEYC